MAPGGLVTVVLALLATAELPPEAAQRRVLVATAVEPLRANKLADALRTYLDASRLEVRLAPAVSSGDLRADLAATVQAGTGALATAVLRIALTPVDTVEIVLSHFPSERTVITTIPRSARDEDLYRTLALKVRELLRTLEEPQDPSVPVTPAPPPRREGVNFDFQIGPTVLAFPAGDLTQVGAVLGGRWAVTPRTRLGLAMRALPASERDSGPTQTRLRLVPVFMTLERLWRGDRLEATAGLLLLAEARYATATAGPNTHDDWAFVPGGGAALGVAIRLSRSVRLSLRAAAIALAWSSRYRVDGATVYDATYLEVPVDLTLDLAL